ncbi:MAG: autotransporter outer membrane beta-barrel domain-containing protein [Akkermansia sp.]
MGSLTRTLSSGCLRHLTEELENKLVIAPFAGLEFMTGKTDSFTESGDLARTFSGARAQNWTLPVGITVSRTLR